MMQEPELEEMLNEMTLDEREFQVLLGGRLWTPKPDYIQHFTQTLYTDAELVDAFVDATYAWYADQANTMYGCQDEVRAELIRCLAENDEPEFSSPESLFVWPVHPVGGVPGFDVGQALVNAHQLTVERYCSMKFSKEWTGPEGMFTEYHPKGML
jgi:hypothetical protein